MGITGINSTNLVGCSHISLVRHRAVFVRNQVGEAPVLYVESTGAFFRLTNQRIYIQCEKCMIDEITKAASQKY